MADESGSGTTTLDRVRKKDDEFSEIDKFLYRDPEEPPSLYRQWTWREAFESPLEFLRSFAMRSGDKPTKENVEASMASGGPISSGALGKFGAVLRPTGRSPLHVAQAEDLLKVARKFYPDVVSELDKLPDIAVARKFRLGPDVLGEYHPPTAMAPPGLRTFDKPEFPGGRLAVGHQNPFIMDELETLAHEGEHAKNLYSPRITPRQPGGLVPNLSQAEALKIAEDYIATGDLSVPLLNNYLMTNPKYGLQHALIEGEARRVMRERWPIGLARGATQPELETVLDRHKSARALLPSNPLSSKWLK